MPRAVAGVVVAAGVLVLAGAAQAVSGSQTAGRSLAAGLPLVKIHFEFKSEERATHYTVVNTGNPQGSLNLATATYKWTLSPPEDDDDCNNRGVLSGSQSEFVWKHGNKGDPVSDDGCDHSGVGPAGHEGNVSVFVKDAKWLCTASYTGTQGADGAASGDGPDGACDQETAPPPPPPPPPSRPCKCILLSVRIVPSTLRITESVDDDELHADLHWQLNCTKGSGGCKADLQVKLPPGGGGLGRWNFVGSDSSETFACRGRCTKITEGTIRSRIETSLDDVQRRGLRIPFVIQRTCAGKKTTPIRLFVAFKQNGNIDLKRSKLR